MKKLDRRKFPRIKVCNPISYNCVDTDGVLIDQSMGIALDISQNGILLETAQVIRSKHVYLLFADLENNIARIIGRVVFSVKNKSGNFKNGINFQGSPDENVAFATKLIHAYQHHKSEPVQIKRASA